MGHLYFYTTTSVQMPTWASYHGRLVAGQPGTMMTLKTWPAGQPTKSNTATIGREVIPTIFPKNHYFVGFYNVASSG